MIDKLLKTYVDREDYKNKIHKVNQKTLNYYVNQWAKNSLEDERRLLYSYDDESGLYIGVDNSNGECWTEEFDSEDMCINWLNNIDK